MVGLIHDYQNWSEFVTTSFGRNVSLFGSRLEEEFILLLVLRSRIGEETWKAIGISTNYGITNLLSNTSPFSLPEVMSTVFYNLSYFAHSQIFLFFFFFFLLNVLPHGGDVFLIQIS